MRTVTRSRPPLAAAIALAFGATSSHAATITVNSSDDDASSAFCNLRDAVLSINSGSNASVPMCGPQTVGAFGNDDTIVFDPSLINSTITLVQGQISIYAPMTITGSGQTIDAHNNGYGVLYADGSLSLNNLTLINGNPYGNGGGIEVTSDDSIVLSLTNMTISGNTATGYGGGIYATGATNTLSLTNVTVSENSAAKGGGGIAFFNGQASLTNSTITSNSSNGGGGAFFRNSNLNLSGCLITSNIGGSYSHPTLYHAGGIDIYNSVATIVNSQILSNSNPRDYGTGGMLVRASNLTLTNSSVADNTGYCIGGIRVDAIGSTATVFGSTISGNSSLGGGNYCAGGLFLDGISGGPVYFVNSTVSGNSSSGINKVAGGLSAYDGTFDLTNTTVSSNTAMGSTSYTAGGVLLGGPFVASTMTLANSIVSANSASILGNPAAMPDIEIGTAHPGVLHAGYSLLGSALNVGPYNDAANHNVFTNSPGLGPLQDNDGLTETMALLKGSEAINAGSNALAVDGQGQPLQTDQTGFYRIFKGIVDMGAVEYPGDKIFANGFEGS